MTHRDHGLTPAERERLVGVLGLLASPFDGERAAAALLATKMLRSKDLTWSALIVGQAVQPYRQPPAWMADLALCRQHPAELNSWEANFVGNLAGTGRPPSPAQTAKLRQVAEKLRTRGLS